MAPATDRQLDVLDYIRQFRWAKGYAPTVAEIAAHFGMYPNAAQDHVQALVKKRLLHRTPRVARSLVPL